MSATKYYEVPIGTPVEKCREGNCGKPLYFIPSPKTGKRMPIDCAGDAECKPPTAHAAGVGVNHFITCTNPTKFRKKP